MSFAAGACRLAALAAQALGWRPGEFWNATPAELALTLGTQDVVAPLSREAIAAMIERDRTHG